MRLRGLWWIVLLNCELSLSMTRFAAIHTLLLLSASQHQWHCQTSRRFRKKQDAYSDFLTYRQKRKSPIRFSIIVTGLLTPRSGVPLEKLIVTQLAKTISAFYGTRKFITVFTKYRYQIININKAMPIHNFTLNFCEIPFNLLFFLKGEKAYIPMLCACSVSVCPTVEVSNNLNYFCESWYERCVIWSHPSARLYSFLQSSITMWRMREPMMWERNQQQLI